ncbi:hypothetical protein A3F62_05500 [Candidatus Woesebacteria bacterium RIFCSPHIGHO2_12_FULL_44_11]|uniref:ArnT-like N-terminal domain-containing protein n=1 Tax=Candidatus Woesebacteria bacterium RIFCSPLOWO2_01_FULL_44_14 TaxID=1802525 RepID=A0A1F8C0V6_9BACT|nr:MAG: hypothetical protein A3F62_05500 [Candidatus Woesebacteria bacterium RIFCSPHIGHO2_12_FULL_44_11]OGM69902.1 MAG: hypothetical protein A2975_04815 [Candidatus Woesebacteria bacterium RIFCSPLOWO2_01_FULL_44_14]
MGKLTIFLRKNQWLFLILVLAALLRFIGTKPGYNPFHPDEPILTGKAMQIIRTGDLDPGRYDYPALPIYIDYLFFKFFFIPISWLLYYLKHVPDIVDGVVHIPPSALEVKRLFQVEILGVRDINALFWGRYVVALFSVGSVFLTYLLGSKLFNKTVGLIAAFLLVFNFKHVANSHINLPDIYNAFFLLASLVASVTLWQKPTRRNYLLAGIAVGLSLATKYQIFALFPFGLAHLYHKKLFTPVFMASVLMIPLVFLLINAYFFINIEVALTWLVSISGRYAVGTNKLNLFPLSYLYHIDYGPVELGAAILGIVLVLIKFFKKGLFLLAVVVPFVFFFFYYTSGGLFVRNFVTITPVFLIFAAFSIWRIAPSRLVLAPLVLGAILVPAKNSLLNSYYYTKPWNYDVLKDWQKQNLPDSIAVAAHPFDPIVGPTHIVRSEFEISGNYSLNEHKEAGADWALVNLMWAANPFYFWMGYGLDEIALFWDKPLDELRNMYHGLATEELLRYQVFSAVKPWQAPEFNYVMVKLPDWPETRMTVIRTFDFSTDAQGWSSGYDAQVGNAAKGSLGVELMGARFPFQRIVSEPMEVKSSHLYKVTGYLKTQILLASDQRDGTLRIDFFDSNPENGKVGVISSVSSRVWGSDDWIAKQVIERAPDSARFMTVSLQVGSSGRTKVWADDIVVEESVSEVEDPTLQPPYIKKPIDLNLLYFNSIGNL